MILLRIVISYKKNNVKHFVHSKKILKLTLYRSYFQPFCIIHSEKKLFIEKNLIIDSHSVFLTLDHGSTRSRNQIHVKLENTTENDKEHPSTSFE